MIVGITFHRLSTKHTLGHLRCLRSSTSSTNHVKVRTLDTKPFELLFQNHKLLEELLESYETLHGHVYIPISYIPNKPHYRDEFHNIKLGKFAYFLRNEMKSNPKIFTKRNGALYNLLKEKNFVWNYNEFCFHRLYSALSSYKKVYNHLEIPSKFIIPKNDAWPKLVHGYKLGFLAEKMRNDDTKFVEYRYILDKIGFDFSKYKEVISPEHALEAIKIFKSLYGDFSIMPYDYTVPSDVEWPKYLWGLNLADLRMNIRRHKTLVNIKDEVIRIDPNFYNLVNIRERYLIFIDAVLSYKKLYGHVRIPNKFVIPAKNDPDLTRHQWPEKTLGLRLGSHLNNVKYRYTYCHIPGQRAEIESLGIVIKRKP